MAIFSSSRSLTVLLFWPRSAFPLLSRSLCSPLLFLWFALSLSKPSQLPTISSLGLFIRSHNVSSFFFSSLRSLYFPSFVTFVAPGMAQWPVKSRSHKNMIDLNVNARGTAFCFELGRRIWHEGNTPCIPSTLLSLMHLKHSVNHNALMWTFACVNRANKIVQCILWHTQNT